MRSEACPQTRKDYRGVNLISTALPFGRLLYGGPTAVANAVGYAQHFSWSHDAVIRVYGEAGNLIETHEHKAISKSGEGYSLKAKSRHAVKHDGLLLTAFYVVNFRGQTESGRCKSLSLTSRILDWEHRRHLQPLGLHVRR